MTDLSHQAWPPVPGSGPEPYDKVSIQSALIQAYQAVGDYFQELEPEEALKGIEGKWSAYEIWEHLILSSKPVASGLNLPKIAFRAMGRPQNPSRTFQELVKDYQDLLSGGGKASKAYIPKEDTKNPDLKAQYDNWNMIGGKFQDRLGKWSEKELDSCLMPHPLLGKLTVREMLLFTIYHTWHHLKQIEQIRQA